MIKPHHIIFGSMLLLLTACSEIKPPPSEKSFIAISAGESHTCGLVQGGAAYCWGDNSSGGLGNNSPILASLHPDAVAATLDGTLLSFTSISTGLYFTCGLTTGGKAFCWGDNRFGQLGNGTIKDVKVPVAVLPPAGEQSLSFSSISTGIDSTCGLTLIGKAYCWGGNEFGQLGNNTTVTANIPVEVSAPKNGNALSFKQLSVGSFFVCGLILDGTGYCWGSNERGALGNNGLTPSGNSTNFSTLPIAIAAPANENPLAFSNISAGSSHVCGLTVVGAAYCWGANFYGELGNGTAQPGIPVQATLRPVAVAAPSGGNILTFTSITTGSIQTCGLTSIGTVYCWGRNPSGQLGNNSITDSLFPVLVSPTKKGLIVNFAIISTHLGAHTCGVSSTGKPYCWGTNVNGALGNDFLEGDDGQPINYSKVPNPVYPIY